VGFLAQFDGFDPSSLGLLQRILLVTDGTLTDALEAAFLEPIGLRKIELNILTAPAPVEELDLPAGAPLLQRKILLYGENTGRSYVYAESQLALDRLPPRFREELMHSDTPMGRLWSEHKMETWKELLTVAQYPMDKLAPYLGTTSAHCLMRRYRLISGGRPLMIIEEHFPARYGPES
jgi:chorismate-pyruvate lyase